MIRLDKVRHDLIPSRVYFYQEKFLGETDEVHEKNK